MTRVRLALGVVGFAFALVVEWATWTGDLGLAVADLLTGLVLLSLGLLAWQRRGSSATGLLLTASGFAWFVGSLVPAALYLHRGVLIHLVLSYPSGRLRSRTERILIAGGYVYGGVYVVARNDVATLVMALALCATAVRRHLVSSGPQRRARAAAVAAAVALGTALTLSAATGLAGIDDARVVLFSYDVLTAVLAVWLFADLLWGRWSQTALTGLVVDLGDVGDAGRLRDRLAHAVGDPLLAVGYLLPFEDRYVDDVGQPVRLPRPGRGRTVTPIETDGERVAVLVHDSGAVSDPSLIAGIASAARLAISNVRLQAQVRGQVASVEASRRRILSAADTERRALEQDLREGAERRLARVADLIGGCPPAPVQAVAAALDRARADLREFARGIHPASLMEGGLAAALRELVEGTPVPIDLRASPDRLPAAIEAAAYFICAEAIANVAKHARASLVRITVKPENGYLIVQVEDDGIGGADSGRGSGLRGLEDRAAALGGRLSVESQPGCGTRLLAELPLAQERETVL